MIGLQVDQNTTMVNSSRALTETLRTIACSKACNRNNSSNSKTNNDECTMQWSSNSSSITTRACLSKILTRRHTSNRTTIHHMVECLRMATRASSKTIHTLWIKMIQPQCKTCHLVVSHINLTSSHTTPIKLIQQAGNLDQTYIIIQYHQRLIC